MNELEQIVATVTDNVFENSLSSITNFKIEFSDLLSILIIFSITLGIHTLFKLFMAWQVKRDKVRKSQSKTLTQLAGYVLFIFAITSSFSAAGYSLTYLLVGSTALLVGLGFGLQQLFVDLISGVILLLDKNINYGDVVKIDIAGSQTVEGKIANIGLRATLIETIDNEMIIVPNSKLMQTGFTSLMRNRGSVRFRVSIPVDFSSDMNKVREIMYACVKANPKVDKNSDLSLIIKEFLNNGVLVEVRFWMKELFNSEIILSDIRFEILKQFRENGITIPYPHMITHKGSSVK